MARTRRLIVGIAASTVAIVVVGFVARLLAFNPQPDPPGFGMVGIVEGQTARLNLVNLGNGPSEFPPPCRATLQFFDGEGNVLAERRVRLEAGRAAFLDLTPTSIPANTVGDVLAPPRAQIRAAINPTGGEYPPPCRATLEIFDNATSRTGILYQGNIPPPCRGPRCMQPY
jgi:hypothetical protein